MLNKAVIYLLLLNLLNTVFFVGEQCDSNPYDAVEESIEAEEYNSVVEFVVEGCMDVQDDTPDDEDDDVPDSFDTQKQIDYYFLTFFEFVAFTYIEISQNTFFDISEFDSCSPKKDSPPPKFV